MPDKKELLQWKNIEWFTPDDYLRTPSASTVFEEEKVNVYSKYLYNNTAILNQWRVPSCTVSWLTKSENEAEHFDNWVLLNDQKLWRYASDNWYTNYNDGWSMSGALGLFKDLKYLADWYLVNNPEEAKIAFSKKHILYCGTRMCDWYASWKYWKFIKSEGNNIGHVFACIGIDADEWVYIFANSRGDRRGNKGLFTATFEEVRKYFYTMIAIIDKDDDPVISDLTDSRNMVEIEVWNGKLPDAELIKLHAVYMVMRAFFNEFDNQKAIDQALEDGIVSSVNWPLTKRRFLYMVYRCITEIKDWNEEHIANLAIEQWIIKNLDWIDEPIKRYHASLIIARVLRMIER